jgi:hypothetical protein
MKKFFLILLLMLVVAVPVMAGDFSKEIAPGLNVGFVKMDAGMYWQRKSGDIKLGAQFSALDYRELLTLNLGTLTTLDSNPPLITGFGLNINTLANLVGLGYHLPGNSQIGLFRSWDLSAAKNEGNDWGVYWIFPLQ